MARHEEARRRVVLRGRHGQTLGDERGVVAARQGEAQAHLAAPAVQVVGFGRRGPQEGRLHEQRSVLALRPEAGDVERAEGLGVDALGAEHRGVVALGLGRQLVALAEQRQARGGELAAELGGQLGEDRQGAVVAGQPADRALRRDRAHPQGRGAVPQVRLVGEQVDRPLARGDAAHQGAEEVPRLVAQVLEQRGAAAAAAVRGQLRPVAPAPRHAGLEALDLLAAVLRRRAHQRAQRALGVAPQQLTHDEALAVPQAAEALVVEVGRQPDLLDHRQVAADARHVGRLEVAQDDLEAVAGVVLALDRAPRRSDAAQGQGAVLELHRPPAAHGHELAGDAVLVLEPGVGHVLARDAGLAGQGVGRLVRGQAALGDAVEGEGAGPEQGVLVEDLEDPEVILNSLQAHGAISPFC